MKNLTLKELMIALARESLVMGDEVRIVPDVQIVDLRKVVDTLIPMVFWSDYTREHKQEFFNGIEVDASKPYICGRSKWRYVKFATTLNNWVAWNTEVPRYTGRCPLPNGVLYQVSCRNGQMRHSGEVSPRDWDNKATSDRAIMSYRVTGLAPGWAYPWDDAAKGAERIS